MRKYGKKLLGLLLAASLLVTGVNVSGVNSSKASAADDSQRNNTNVVKDGKLSDSNLTTEHLSANGIKTKDNGLMRANISSKEFMTKDGMGLGWNLGNQLEESNVSGYRKTVEECETNAGNPVATQKTFDGLKKTGVNTVRVPVAWSNFLTMEIPKEDGTVEKVTGANNMYKAVDAINTPMEGVTPATEDTYYRISTELMDRIETVINYGLNDGMYIIFNIHWDGGWWGMFGAEEWDGTPLAQTDMKKNPIRYQAYKKYTDIWKQLSERFKEYSDHVIFEGANEELSGRLNDDFRDPSKAQNDQTGKLPKDGDKIYQMVNEINQTFVDIVRASGGNNAYRQLLIPGTGNESCVIGGYEGDTYVNDGVMDERFHMPNDPAEELTGKKKMSISVHYYDPTVYGISATATTPWGYQDTWGTEQDKKDMDNNLSRLVPKFSDQGYGVILGECGCVKGYKDGVTDYADTIFKLALEKGMCPVWWDEGHYYDRSKGYWSYVDLGESFMKVYGITLDPVADKEFINPKPFYTGIKSVPYTENQSPKVVATWEGEFMRHTNAKNSELLLQTRPDDVTQFVNDNGGIEIGIKKTTKEDNLKAVIDQVCWNISVTTDWTKIKEPCVRVYPMDNDISNSADLQLGYIGAYKATDTGVLNGKHEVGDMKGIVKYDVDYMPDCNQIWKDKYVQLDKEALTVLPWLWVTTNTYSGASYVKIEICDAAYNADGSVYGGQQANNNTTTKATVKKVTKSVKVKKSVKIKVRSNKTEKATVKVAKKSIATASLSGNNVVIKGKKKGTTVVTVTTKKKIYKITVKVKK